MRPKRRLRKPLAHKFYLLAFLCVCFHIIGCCYYYYSVPFVSKKQSSFCHTLGSNTNVVIRNICSFVHSLDMDAHAWNHRECYFKHPVEGYEIIGPLLTMLYLVIKHQHCATINVNHLLNPPAYEKQNNEQFTVLINTWQRNECLIKAVQHYLECSHVAQIRIIWSDPHHEIPEYLREQQIKHKSRLVFDEYKNNKLTNRFKYNTEWITDAMFQSDDDIKYSCDLLHNTFKLWTLFPDYMIAFAPRQPYRDDYRTKLKQNAKYQFYAWDAAYTQCAYSMAFPTLGAFMHKKHYKMYDVDHINGIQNGWKQIKDSVNGNITAEDISMSLLYSFSTGYPPITVTIPEREMLDRDFLSCQQDKSLIMHTNSPQKRTKIFVDILSVLGMKETDLISSNLWVDVMPVSRQKCWAC